MKPIDAYLGSLWVEPLEIKLDASLTYSPDTGALQFLITGTVKRNKIHIEEFEWLIKEKDEKDDIQNMIDELGSRNYYKEFFSAIRFIKPKISKPAINKYIIDTTSRCISLLNAFETLQKYEQEAEKKAEKNRKDLIQELIFS